VDDLIEILKQRKNNILKDPKKLDRLKSLNLIVKLKITDENKGLLLILKRGTIEILQVDAEEDIVPNIIISAKKEVVLDILNKNQNVFSAYFAGKFKVEGEKDLLLEYYNLLFE